jgi:hypothetical protein
MIKADLHNHLGRNGDNPGFDQTIDIAHLRLGNGGIFGVANFDNNTYEKFVEQKGGKYNRWGLISDDSREVGVYVPEKGILVLKCQEIPTDRGEVLAIAMPHGINVPSKLKPQNAIQQAYFDYGAILDAVHPLYTDGMGEFLKENSDVLQFFSTFEIHNSSTIWIPGITIRQANSKAFAFYYINNLDEMNIGLSSSTDGHSAEVIGKCYTILPDISPSVTNLSSRLETALRGVKNFNQLHKESNRADALKHGLYVGMDRVKEKFRR